MKIYFKSKLIESLFNEFSYSLYKPWLSSLILAISLFFVFKYSLLLEGMEFINMFTAIFITLGVALIFSNYTKHRRIFARPEISKEGAYDLAVLQQKVSFFMDIIFLLVAIIFFALLKDYLLLHITLFFLIKSIFNLFISFFKLDKIEDELNKRSST